MARQITNKQIRKKLGRAYDFECEYDQERFADALIASVAYREVADKITRAGYRINQVRQKRVFEGFLSICSKPEGLIYLGLSENGQAELRNNLFTFFKSGLDNCEVERLASGDYAGYVLKNNSRYSFRITADSAPLKGLTRLVHILNSNPFEKKDEEVRIK